MEDKLRLIIRTLNPKDWLQMKLTVTCLSLFTVMVMLICLPQAHATVPGMALDGFWSLCSHGYCATSNANASLTTTGSDDVIVLIAQSKGGGNNVTSVSDQDGHVWTLRAATNRGLPIFEYYAIADSPLHADRINVTWQYSDPPDAYRSFVVFGVKGANTNHPWALSFPVERTSWNGSAVTMVPAPGAGDFLIVSTAVNDAPPCYTTTNISPFRNIGEIGTGEYGEADYLISGVGGPHSVSFSCNPYSDPMSFLGDALRGPGT